MWLEIDGAEVPSRAASSATPMPGVLLIDWERGIEDDDRSVHVLDLVDADAS